MDRAPTTRARKAPAPPATVPSAAANPVPDLRAATSPDLRATTAPDLARPAATAPGSGRFSTNQPNATLHSADASASENPPTIPKLAANLASNLQEKSTLRRPITVAGVRRIVQIMTLLQKRTAAYPNFSWHDHVSGHDTKGDVFWLHVFEDKKVLKSS